MIAVDTSTWIGFLQGDRGADAELLDRALQDAGKPRATDWERVVRAATRLGL